MDFVGVIDFFTLEFIAVDVVDWDVNNIHNSIPELWSNILMEFIILGELD